MPEKFCVFCGKRPLEKTMEHVFPQWLIKLTGDPTRIAKFAGLDRPERKYSFNQFKFPACKVCNQRMGEFEGATKTIVEKMLQGEPLASVELELLMHWIDKVRTGTWLAYYALEGDLYPGFSPKFYISQRLGLKDRAIWIGRAKSSTLVLNFFPSAADPFFMHFPSFFAMCINSLAIVSASTDFLISEALGLPHYETKGYTKEGLIVSGAPVYTQSRRVGLPNLGGRFNAFAQAKYYHALDRGLLREQGVDKYISADEQSSFVLGIENSHTSVYPDTPATDWIPRTTSSHGLLVYNTLKGLRRVRKWLYTHQYRAFLDWWDDPNATAAFERVIKMYDNL